MVRLGRGWIGHLGRRRCRCRGIGKMGRGGCGYECEREVKSWFGVVVVGRFGEGGVVM